MFFSHSLFQLLLGLICAVCDLIGLTRPTGT